MWTRIAIAAALVAAAVLGALAYAWLRRLGQRIVLGRRRRRGRRGEQDAIAVLAAAGYEVLDEQVSREVTLFVDGTDRTYTLRPDYLVRRGGRDYVAEVKTGAKAPDPLYANTRRQLLEYDRCFPDCGLLLVDMEAGQVHEVRWDRREGNSTPSRRSLPWLVGITFGLGLALGLAAGLATC